MPSDKKIRVAIVGLGFGAEFIPIYQNHPNANMYAICQRNDQRLNKVGDEFDIAARSFIPGGGNVGEDLLFELRDIGHGKSLHRHARLASLGDLTPSPAAGPRRAR